MMLSRGLRLACLSVVATLSAVTAMPCAWAQQITYYDFNGAASAPGANTACTPSTNTPLICLNNSPLLPNSAGPSYAATVYPAAIDPTANGSTDQPPYQAVQLTQSAGSQDGSLWFKVPQKVASGFTAYFTFQITPDPSSVTADGLAFVIQNAQGGGVVGTNDGSSTYCAESGSGVTVTGNNGGCIGYGGIDNSVAFEFDTFTNGPFDPFDLGQGNYNDNHIAIMSCGAAANSPDHTGNCQVYLNPGTNAQQEALVSNPSGVRLADGNIHQVVITYNGPNEANPNLVQIFIDPPFNPGTHTPTANAVPALSGVYNLTANLNLINSGTRANPSLDSAYVGFTSSTGASYEGHKLLNWTYTPHTPVTQAQPLQPGGTTTVFPFGAHTYGVTYPASVNTAGISMTVTAYPITQALFTQLVNGGPFAGSQCQVYDETGGNCIVYSVSCVTTATGAPVACPAATEADPITIKSAYNDSVAPVTPGFIQGDPFYSQVTSITGDGTTATVNCTGECAVTAGQTVTVAAAQDGSGNPSGFNGAVTVVATPATNQFTFASAVSGSATGGYLTSTNVKNIFFQQLSYRQDPTTTGKTQNFSDFVVTGVTVAATKLVIAAPATAYGLPAPVTVTATSGNGVPTGNVALVVDGGTPITQPLVAGTTTFTLTGLSAGPHTLAVTYAQSGTFQAATSTGSVTVLAPAAAALVTPSSLNFGTLYLGQVSIKTVTLQNTGTAPLTVTTPFIQDVGNGDSKEFIALSLCPRTLAVGKSCSIYVTFLAGPAYAPQTAVLKVMDSAAGSPQLVPLTATVINPQATFTPYSVAFGSDKVGAAPLTSAVVLKNTGATPLSIAGMKLTGADPGDFSFANSCPASLNSGASCTIPLTFKPMATGTRSAQLTVSDNAASSTQQVKLTGTGK